MPNSGVLSNHKKEQRIDARCDMDDLWKRYARWTPDKKGHVFYDST